ncbi:hypothetical protein SYK_27930 [Pseudodesulfovibrio nedwellii]|uniref:DNA-binding protein n=1 Tax=Pseudodesulfovibrio nedwellii TaxID=2973072 RepID=A0ABN6S8C3_9BACT|nr:hypothetical protein [Pseudodesulfovibrio nedwellii]BDQ38433.1 hypothetical protein SYK_27930 [Pseudodesulfovibrio nedwellii]
MTSKDNTSIQQVILQLEKEFPPLISRSLGSKATGYTVAERTFANLDSKGEGPAERLRIGRRVCYPRSAFISWVLERLEVDND